MTLLQSSVFFNWDVSVTVHTEETVGFPQYKQLPRLTADSSASNYTFLQNVFVTLAVHRISLLSAVFVVGWDRVHRRFCA